ncbi:hypothetical protein [Shimia sp.]|uniref:hypothetical protein n=1 Tax=Shimia sp. TaxID=1954381 RepID=UPI003BAC4566
MTTEDMEALAAQILSALQGALSDGWDQIDAFHKSQSEKLTRQAALLVQIRISGELKDSPEMFDFMIEQLQDKVENFAIAVANLTVLTLQNAWNASVEVIWGAINAALEGASLPALPIPEGR